MGFRNTSYLNFGEKDFKYNIFLTLKTNKKFQVEKNANTNTN